MCPPSIMWMPYIHTLYCMDALPVNSKGNNSMLSPNTSTIVWMEKTLNKLGFVNTLGSS